MILQFQADAKAMYVPPLAWSHQLTHSGYKSRPPARLQTRLTAAWRNYDAIRRHVEWFIVSPAPVTSSIPRCSR